MKTQNYQSPELTIFAFACEHGFTNTTGHLEEGEGF